MAEYYPEENPFRTSTICDCPPCDCSTGAQSDDCVGDDETSSSTVLHSGQFTFQLGLMSINAFGVAGWNFGLNYLRTQNNEIGDLLGPGFNYTQYMRLVAGTDGKILLITRRNTSETFEPLGGGVYSSVSNNTRAILAGDSSGFTLQSSSGVTTLFNALTGSAPGRMTKITDRYGNTQELTWANVGGVIQLTKVVDGYGRQIVYRYFGSERNYQLREIEDFLGRKLNFQYDTASRLVAVVTPSITKATEGNTFPGGTAYVFQYDTGNPRPERQNDLIRIWYPNEATPFVDPATRTVDVSGAYASAQPRYTVEYGQDPTDQDHYGRVAREMVGDPNGGPGGTYGFIYITDPSQLPSNLIDPFDPITQRTVATDPYGNQVVYDFNAAGMTVRKEVLRTRSKLAIPTLSLPSSYVTWTRYNAHNQPVMVVYPEGNSVERVYDDGTVTGFSEIYAKRIGLLKSETYKPGNTIGIPSRSGSSGQTELTRLYFYDPLFNRQCAVVERRGNPIDGSTFYTPQNGGTTPTSTDRHRYATITYFDYQKDTQSTVANDTSLQTLLGLSATQIGLLIAHVQAEMSSKFPASPTGYQFDMGMGDINGDGTGEGTGRNATHRGDVVKIKHPSVRQLVENESGDPWQWVEQRREELFTINARGQNTTHTDPEGNLTVYVRYPYSDPEGDGQFVSDTATRKQYGRVKEVHADADPNDVMSLVGEDGDLADFVIGVYPRNSRTNTPDTYQDLVTRYQGIPGGVGCSSCGYDPMGNVLSQTDPRGFTTTYYRNELGEAYRVTSPAPYNNRQETWFDANRNVIRVDIEDKVVAFASQDPTDADYAKYMPTGSGSTAHVPTMAGDGGSIRPGWFTNLYSYDLLDSRILEDIDATGSTPQRLVTAYEFDPNRNLVKITKPMGNIVEYDYDERNLRIATRIGYVAGTEAGAVSISVYDGNGNLIDEIGPVDRLGGGGPTTLTAILSDAFRSSSPMTHVGTWAVQNTLDGFDRITQVKDAIGGVMLFTHDPDGRVVTTVQQGQPKGASPTARTGSGNVNLARSSSCFDEAGRAYESQQNVFINSGWGSGHGVPSGHSVTHTGGGLAANSTTNNHTVTVTLTDGESSYVLTRNVFDRSGRMIALAMDNGAVAQYEFDGIGRQIKATDPLGNIVETSCDAAGNVIHTRRRELPAIDTPPKEGLAAEEVFESFACYDALNRLTVSGSQGADGSLDQDLKKICAYPPATQTLVTRLGYDSRGNQTLAIDPQGNTSINVFDGASRQIESNQHLRQDGKGGAPEPNATFLADGGATVRTLRFFDANSRLTQLVDDRGGTTTYTLDTLDRQVSMTFHDGSTRTTLYNEASDVLEYTDENGSVFTNTFDAIGRPASKSINPAAGVESMPVQVFQYDGLSRTTYAADDVSGGQSNVFTYDSLGHSLEEAGVYSKFTSLVPTCLSRKVPQPLVMPSLFPQSLLQGSWSPQREKVDINHYAISRVARYSTNFTPATPVVDSNTVAYWPMDEGTGTVLHDETDNYADAWFANNVPEGLVWVTWVDGSPAVRSLDVYNLNRRIQTPDAPAFIPNAFTIEFRFRGLQTSLQQTKVFLGDPNAPCYLWWYDGGGGWFNFKVRNATGDTTAQVSFQDATLLWDGNIHHLAVCWDGSTVRFFADGILKASAAFSGEGTYSDLDFTYDSLYRRTTITDHDTSEQVALWSFWGPSRVAELKLGNGLVCSYLNNARTRSAMQYGLASPAWGDVESDRLGYDGAGRMIAKRYIPGTLDEANGYADTTAVAGFTTEYDLSSDKIYERHLHAENRSHLYPAYDSLDRLREYQRGTLAKDSTTGVVSVSSSITLPNANVRQTYDLDGLGNWRRTGIAPVGATAATQVRQHNALNQVTKFGDTAVLYDHGNNTYPLPNPDPATANRGNGNIVDDGTNTYSYDPYNRMVGAASKAETPAYDPVKYVYDPVGRLVKRLQPASGTAGTSHSYMGSQCLVDWDASGSASTLRRAYAWGRYVDELIRQEELDGETPLAYYPLTDLLYRTVALTDSSGQIVEAYDTDAYGNTLVFDSPGTGDDWFAEDAHQTTDAPMCRYIFTGRELDPSTRLYYYRARHYSPPLGRFMQKDPILYGDGMNLYQYAGGNPVRFIDATGLAIDPGKDCGLWARSNQGNFIGPIKKPIHFWINSDSGELWDFGPDDKWLTREYGNNSYGDCTILKYCRGEANWGGNAYATEKGDVNNSPKLQIIGLLWYGKSSGKNCQCATCEDIKSCLDEVRNKWNGTRYDHFARNCGTFVLEAATACCLWGV